MQNRARAARPEQLDLKKRKRQASDDERESDSVDSDSDDDEGPTFTTKKRRANRNRQPKKKKKRAARAETQTDESGNNEERYSKTSKAVNLKDRESSKKRFYEGSEKDVVDLASSLIRIICMTKDPYLDKTGLIKVIKAMWVKAAKKIYGKHWEGESSFLVTSTLSD